MISFGFRTRDQRNSSKTRKNCIQIEMMLRKKLSISLKKSFQQGTEINANERCRRKSFGNPIYLSNYDLVITTCIMKIEECINKIINQGLKARENCDFFHIVIRLFFNLFDYHNLIKCTYSFTNYIKSNQTEYANNCINVLNTNC